MLWTTGDLSGGIRGLYGTGAVAGFSASDDTSFTVPGSRNPAIINIVRRSNIGIPGIWMFQVGGTIHAIRVMLI